MDDATAPTAMPSTQRPTQLSDPALPISDGLADTAEAPLSGKVDALAVVERSHYEILGEFGRGGLGRVLRARDRRTGRIVAIKEVIKASPSLLARFAREAVVTANLQHPAIVPVYEVGRWPTGEPFYAMKLVAGKSLLDVLGGKKTLRERVELLAHVTAVADALAYAHGERVIHRDLKPANVLIGDYGETVVIDWGLAKRLGDADDLGPGDDALIEGGKTAAGVVMGTPGYMAPEQARGEPADARSDVYAIGAMLYEVLAGVRPYHETPTPDEVIRLATERPPQPLAEIAPEIPSELVAIVERAMAFAAADRYRDAKQLADDLKRYQTGQLVGAHEYSAWQLFARFVRRHLAVVVATGVGVIALSALGTYSVVRIRGERDVAIGAQRLAEDRNAALAEEQGRELTVTGDPAHGLPYLASAVASGRHSPALAFVVARALEPLAQVEAVLPASTAPLTAVGYSRDGARVVTVDGDGKIKAWDARAYRLVRELGTATTAMPSPDGAYIAAITDAAGTVELRDFDTGAVLRVLSGKLDDRPSQIAISTHGERVALAGQGGAVAWWDAATGTRIARAANGAPVMALAFSGDGALIAAGLRDGHARAWRTADGAQIADVKMDLQVVAVGWSPDGKRLAVGSQSGHAEVVDVASGKSLLKLAHEDSVESIAFDRAGARLLTGSRDGTVGVWDAATGAKLATMTVGHRVLDARFASDEASIVTRDEHGDIKRWTPAGLPLETLSGHNSATGDLALSPDGKQLASVGVDGDLRLWRLAAAPAATVLDNAGTTSWWGAFSSDGKLAAISGADGVVRIFDAHSGALVRELRGHAGKITSVELSADGARLLTCGEDGTARVWNAATGDAIAVLRAGSGRVRAAAWSPDGAVIATTQEDAARLWRDGKVIATLAPAKGVPRIPLWSPDGQRVLVTLDGAGAALYAASGELIGTATLPTSYVTAAAWTRDGGLFALGGSDTRPIAVFDGHSAAPKGLLQGHTLAPIFAIEASPDGRDLVSSAGDGFAHVWHDVDTRLTLGDGGSLMLQAAYRPDSALVATGNSDGFVQVWETRSGKEVGRLQAGSAIARLRWSHDGEQLLVLTNARPLVWHVPEWHGSASELAARLRCALHVQLVEATLVRATPDPAACAK